MKELRGSATALVDAPLDACLALVEAVDRYPDWHPEVVERDGDGVPSRARTELHVEVGPLKTDFDLLMAVTVEPPGTVKLVKVGGSAKFNVIWRLESGGGTRLSLDLDANLEVPRFLPLGGVGDSLAHGFVSAASEELARRGSN
jgi:carbon monoxide dehydrogenase subunit G